MFYYYVIYKPYGVLSQFSREAPHHRTLADLYDFPKDVYPVGRLDQDSEGLLIITNDKRLNSQLLNPRWAHERSYWVQVEGIPNEEALTRLNNGVNIRIKKRDYRTRPAKAKLLDPFPTLPDRDPPIRVRKSIPDSWIELRLTEGKNRQVRRMCATVGFPVLRLVRAAIENLTLGDMQPGDVREWQAPELLRALKLRP
ncbi:pseudouridine synthase [Lewinella sp. LCG006]|uniref:pseudouridine synthase n=1 Tax=Lewinella sp. LCG006 TaxID=3231911 RepID=UPI003460E75D